MDTNDEPFDFLPLLARHVLMEQCYELPELDRQMAELSRLCATLLLVPKLHWIVVEDSRDELYKNRSSRKTDSP